MLFIEWYSILQFVNCFTIIKNFFNIEIKYLFLVIKKSLFLYFIDSIQAKIFILKEIFSLCCFFFH